MNKYTRQAQHVDSLTEMARLHPFDPTSLPEGFDTDTYYRRTLDTTDEFDEFRQTVMKKDKLVFTINFEKKVQHLHRSSGPASQAIPSNARPPHMGTRA